MDYTSYLGKRLAQLVPVLLGLTVVVFLMIHSIPGNTADALLGDKGTPENVARLTQQLGLDRPLPVQYLYFVKNLVSGDLGQSYRYGQPVQALLAARLGPTLFLTLYAVGLSVLISLPLSILAAVRQNRWPDLAVRTLSLGGFVMPSYWVALMLMLLFSIKLRILPLSGYGRSIPDHFRYLLLPAFTIAVAQAPVLIRPLRAKILATLRADFVMTAWAKGVPASRVMLAHVLRNSLISTITILGVNIGWMLGGAVIVETVFSVPGLGSLLIEAITKRDYPVVQGLTLCMAAMVMCMNLITDLVYTVLDPRVDYGK
ncbi:MAG: binding-protein-dependent transport system inner rane component [Firmicutes bacterium]|nr:binding-protein-dependent transport system inner rane component [Bacillota bacterium]